MNCTIISRYEVKMFNEDCRQSQQKVASRLRSSNLEVATVRGSSPLALRFPFHQFQQLKPSLFISSSSYSEDLENILEATLLNNIGLNRVRFAEGSPIHKAMTSRKVRLQVTVDLSFKHHSPSETISRG